LQQLSKTCCTFYQSGLGKYEGELSVKQGPVRSINRCRFNFYSASVRPHWLVTLPALTLPA